MACSKNKVPVNDVLYDLAKSKSTIAADGNSKIIISVKLNNDSDPLKRNIIFKTSVGNFTGGLNGMLTVKADFDHDTLKAQAILTAPFSPGIIYLSVWPDIDHRENYTLYDSIIVTPSSPFTIKLNTSSFGLKANYQSEDTIIAVLSNSQGNGVSLGTKVLFDVFLTTGQTRCRAVQKCKYINQPTIGCYCHLLRGKSFGWG